MDNITHARVLKIALPIVLSNATVPLIGAVDTGVVGQMGQAAPIGAVGIGAVILAAIYWIFGFLRMGTSGLVAQSHGAKDPAETGAILMRALLIGLAAGAVFILFHRLLFALGFAIAPASAEVEELATQYLTIRVWGAPATIALYAVTGWLIAVERTRAVLVLQLWINALNVILDIWFVLGQGWGIEGVAAASLIAEWSGLALGLWLCRPAFAGGQWHDWARVFDRARVKRMMQVNGDIMLRSILLQGAFTGFIFMSAAFGDVTLAANQVLLQFLEITAYGLDGFAFAAESLVGQAVGARSVRDVRRASVLTSQWGVGGSLVLGIFFWVAGPGIIDLMTTEPHVRIDARSYLPWVAVAPVIGIASWMFDGIFIGATRAREMRNSAAISVLVYAVAVVVLSGWGNHGLWAALMVMNVTRAVTLGAVYGRVERAAA
ncbi:MATE family efflux transporter [Defluviimonas sp. WL0002]|uniref:MATE family efflux transporter n=1 Tax=Albidovulum marisflavi TaxID=2984159 RepID=A0ABT2ZB70_9RHOB|nr:MATE family efflux transporter [Defluviimonas sp. WL0002]MCV2868282.1 MATE family efflux transporter [Defluviimonas sp. WL0002]